MLRTPDERFVGLQAWDLAPRDGDVSARDGAAGQPHVVFEAANHFIQEDVAADLVEVIDGFVCRNA